MTSGVSSVHRSQPLRSFWIGGYEGADHVNAAGQALDMAQSSHHLQRLDEDYARADRLGIRTVRESIGWRVCEGPGGQLDLSRVLRIARAARQAGIQPLWTLMHYGVPPDLSLFDDALIERFAHFCTQVARLLLRISPAPRFYTPINEISFLAWAASTGGLLGAGAAGHAADASLAGASTEHSGYLVKRRLVRAALAGMAALRAVDPTARFLHVEPLVHVSAPPDRPELAPLAQQIRDYQWQALDLLSGRLEPELGGHEAALDWLGFNHYHSSQWEAVSEARLSWHRRDPRRQPLSELLQEAWLRYRRPLLLAETGHVGMGRAAWLHDVAGEALRARAMGLPLRGICLYPLLDRPDWQDPARWHRCGLWQVHGGAASLAPSSSSSPSLSPAPAPDAAQGTARQARPGSRHLVHAYASALKSWECLPAPPPARPRRLLVLLPSRWEALDAGLQLLLRRLSGEAPACPALRQVAARSGGFAVVLVEPPRGQHARPRLRRYRLGPALELLVAHGLPGAGAWPQGIAALPLVNAELEPGPAGGTLLWLMRWPRESPGTAWLRSALQPDALVLQPDAQDAGPDGATSLGRADLLLCESDAQYSHYSNHHSRVLRLPAGLPPRWLRPPPPGSYEALEAQRLLGAAPGPRLLVPAPEHWAVDPSWLRALALLRPHWHCFVLGLDASACAPLSPNCHALGELAPELVPALLHACDAGLILARPGPATAHLRPELLDAAGHTGLPLASTPLAELCRLAPRPGLRLAADAASMVAAVEALLQQGRQPPTRRQVRDGQQASLTQELALVKAFVELLDARRRPAVVAPSAPAARPQPG